MAKIVCNFISSVLQRTVDITVVIPSMTIPESLAFTGGLKHKEVHFDKPEYEKYVGRPKYPVLYLFHGMGNNHATWTGYTNVELYAEERNMAVVMFAAENKAYIDHEADRFYEFIEDELMDFVCGMFPISQRPEDTYLAGLSMGGYGAMVHGLNNPEKYKAVGIFSASMHFGPFLFFGDENTEFPDKFEIKKMLEKTKNENIKMPLYYFACGEDDDIEDVRYTMEQFQKAGAETTWHQLPGYEHEWRYWDKEVELFMDWIPRSDHYANKKKRRI